MDTKRLASIKMKIARSPRELEQLRAAVRMELYLEVKNLSERRCLDRFTKAECGRMSVEVVNRLCGEPGCSPAVALPPGMADAIETVLLRIRNDEPDLCIAASFMRWSRAVRLLMQLKNDEAEAELRAALELNPRNAFAYCSLAYLAGFGGEPRRAIDLARKALELDPGLAEAWVELGNAYEAAGEHNSALAAWEQAQSLNPDIVRTRDRLDAAALGLPGRDRPEHYDILDDGL